MVGYVTAALAFVCVKLRAQESSFCDFRKITSCDFAAFYSFSTQGNSCFLRCAWYGVLQLICAQLWVILVLLIFRECCSEVLISFFWCSVCMKYFDVHEMWKETSRPAASHPFQLWRFPPNVWSYHKISSCQTQSPMPSWWHITTLGLCHDFVTSSPPYLHTPPPPSHLIMWLLTNTYNMFMLVMAGILERLLTLVSI